MAPCWRGIRTFSDFFSLPPGFGLSSTLNAVPRAAALPPPPPLIPPPPPPPILTDNSGPTEMFFDLNEAFRAMKAGEGARTVLTFD